MGWNLQKSKYEVFEIVDFESKVKFFIFKVEENV